MDSIVTTGFKEAEALLNKLPGELLSKATKKAIKATSQIVIDAGSKAAPRSLVSGTWFTQSKKTREKSPMPLAETLVSKIKSYRFKEVTVGIVGPSWPAGNHGHLVESGHKARFWGRPATGAVVPGKAWFAPVIDSTREQQNAKMIEVLSSEVAKIK